MLFTSSSRGEQIRELHKGIVVCGGPGVPYQNRRPSSRSLRCVGSTSRRGTQKTRVEDQAVTKDARRPQVGENLPGNFSFRVCDAKTDARFPNRLKVAIGRIAQEERLIRFQKNEGQRED